MRFRSQPLPMRHRMKPRAARAMRPRFRFTPYRINVAFCQQPPRWHWHRAPRRWQTRWTRIMVRSNVTWCWIDLWYSIFCESENRRPPPSPFFPCSFSLSKDWSELLLRYRAPLQHPRWRMVRRACFRQIYHRHCRHAESLSTPLSFRNPSCNELKVCTVA